MGSPSATVEAAHDVVVDAAGNVYVTGVFGGTVDFGGGPLVSAGAADIFLAKYNASGVHQWSQRFGSTGADQCFDVAVDGSGNVYVTGSFTGTVNFGGAALVSAGSTDIFLAKYNTAGVHQWSKRFGSVDVDEGHGLDVDNAGTVVVSGYFSSTANFGGANLTSAGLQDVFLAKYNTAGAHQWSQRFGGTGYEEGDGLDIGPSGEVVLTGVFEASVNFGGSTLTSAGSWDAFLAKYNSSGVHQWSQRYGSTSTDGGNCPVVDSNGNVMLAGFYDGTINLGGSPLPSFGASDGFLVKLNSSGVHQWSKHVGGTNNDGGNYIALTAANEPILIGYFNGTANFGGSPLTSAGAGDVYLAKYDANGAHQWSGRFGGTDTDTGLASVVDARGNIIVCGEFGTTIDFGNGSIVSAGNADAFVLKFGPGPPEPDIASIVDVGNDQGRQVTIRCARSGFDSQASASPIVQYEAFRRNDPVASAVTPAPEAGHAQLSAAAAPTQWLFAGAVPAHGEPDFLINVPTAADSTVADGLYNSVFFIRAATADPYTFFDSPIDSGYSVDNLSPSAPTHLVYTSGALAWDESTAGDFNYFSVYGSESPNFDVSAVVINHTTGTTANVSAIPHAYYYVTATDFSGNEGAAARVNTLTGIDAPTSFTLGVNAYPNPFNPSTTVRYDVPMRGRVRVSVFDARGALVTTLVNEDKDAGSYPVRWEGTDARGGRVSSGVYFVRLSANGAAATHKIVLVK